MLPASARRLSLLFAMGLLAGLAAGCRVRSDPVRPPLVLESRIPLSNVAGRIDHLALDPAGKRLFVTELGNGSVDAVDLQNNRPIGRIGGLKEPQGVGVVPKLNELVVASGGDGTVRFYRASNLAPVGLIKLGENADNVRVDGPTDLVGVGYGSGALALIDPKKLRLVRRITLPAHPEGFQFDGARAFVNVPEAGEIAVMDDGTGRRSASWPNPRLRANFPMAVDPASGLVAVVYRSPAKLVLFQAGSGAALQTLDTCGDADDVWFDAHRRRMYVICGSGSVDVFQARGDGYVRAARIATRGGARTGVFSPQLDRLYVALRASGDQPAAIWAFRPQ